MGTNSMKYRIVNAFDTPNLKLWVIEKKRKFLWWSWWVEFSTFGYDYYVAKNYANQLNGLRFEYDSYDEMVEAIKNET